MNIAAGLHCTMVMIGNVLAEADALWSPLLDWLKDKSPELAALLSVVVSIWWNWDKIQKVPGIADAVDIIPRWLSPLERTEGDRFSIVIARLANDKEGRAAEVVYDGLLEFQKSIQALRFKREIKNDEHARRILRKSA